MHLCVFLPALLPSSHPANPLSVLFLMFDLPSPQLLLPLSLHFGCAEVSLSLMTGLLPARPTLCPQLVQPSREAEGQGSGEMSLSDPGKLHNHLYWCMLLSCNTVSIYLCCLPFLCLCPCNIHIWRRCFLQVVRPLQILSSTYFRLA